MSSYPYGGVPGDDGSTGGGLSSGGDPGSGGDLSGDGGLSSGGDLSSNDGLSSDPSLSSAESSVDPSNGMQSNDLYSGMQSTDPYSGEQSSDPYIGGQGNDPYSGGQNADAFSGGQSNDPYIGGQSNDPYSGGQTTDPYSGEQNNDPSTYGQSGDPYSGLQGDDSIGGMQSAVPDAAGVSTDSSVSEVLWSDPSGGMQSVGPIVDYLANSPGATSYSDYYQGEQGADPIGGLQGEVSGEAGTAADSNPSDALWPDPSGGMQSVGPIVDYLANNPGATSYSDYYQGEQGADPIGGMQGEVSGEAGTFDDSYPSEGLINDPIGGMTDQSEEVPDFTIPENWPEIAEGISTGLDVAEVFAEDYYPALAVPLEYLAPTGPVITGIALTVAVGHAGDPARQFEWMEELTNSEGDPVFNPEGMGWVTLQIPSLQ
jgi:hypothetical protein